MPEAMGAREEQSKPGHPTTCGEERETNKNDRKNKKDKKKGNEIILRYNVGPAKIRKKKSKIVS